MAVFSSSCQDLVCTFNAGASQNAQLYTWDFGDSTSGPDAAVVSHTYFLQGGFTVILTVTDGSGQQATVEQSVATFDDESFLVLFVLPD